MAAPVTQRLKNIRKDRIGLSMDDFAKEIGYAGASSYQRYERDDYRKPFLPVDLVRRIDGRFTGEGEPPLTAEEVWELAGPFRRPTEKRPSEVDVSERMELPRIDSMPRDLPVFGTAVGGNEGDFLLNGTTVDYVRRPPALASIKDAFAVFLQGDSMAPRFERGELLYIHPGRPATPGRYVLVEMHGEHGEPGASYVKRLLKRNAAVVVLEQFNPPETIELPAKEVRAVYPILNNAELMGL